MKEISGARVPPTKVILAQIRDVAVPSKIVSIFWYLKFSFSSPFKIVDVGFYLRWPILQTQQTILETQHNIFETQHKIIETQHDIIQTQH